MLKILVLGATSAIAHETIKHFAAEGAAFYLVARHQNKLDAVKDDLRVRGAVQVETHILDMNDMDQHQAMFDAAVAALDGIDAVLLAHGTLGVQEETQASVAATLDILNTNFVSYASILTIIANYMEARRRGVIAVISSVAGDRGRQTNYIYGSAQGAKRIFSEGLRNRLAKKGVHVLTIKPGQISTPMTADLPKSPLFVEAEVVGRNIYKAMKAGKNEIYSPWFWRYIMWIIKSIPEPIYKRLGL
jgi:short-subunit dehydrogenase